MSDKPCLNETSTLVQRETENSDVTEDHLNHSAPQASDKAKVEKYRPNWCYLSIVILFAILASSVTQLAFAQFNRLNVFMEVRFNWKKEDVPVKLALYNAALVPSVIASFMLAAFLMKRGRMITVTIGTVILSLSVVLQMIENEWSILMGRVIIGFIIGFVAIPCQRILEETVPIQLYGPVFVGHLIAANGLAELLMIVASKGLPDSTDIEGLKTTSYWRIYVGLPLIFCAAILLMSLFIIKLESPKYYTMIGDDDKALVAIKKIYHRDENFNAVLEYIKNNTAQEQDTVTLKQALCDSRHSKVTYAILILLTLAAMNGSNMFNGQAQMILIRIFEGGEGQPTWINDSFALDMRGIVDVIAQPFSIILIAKVKRRPVFLACGASLAIVNVCLAFSDLMNVNIIAFFSYLVLTFIIECFTPITQLYMIEVTSNAAFGLIGTYNVVFNMTLLMGISVVLDTVGLPVIFFFCAGSMILCTLYIFFFIKETADLTDKEKKAVYAPKSVQ